MKKDTKTDNKALRKKRMRIAAALAIAICVFGVIYMSLDGTSDSTKAPPPSKNNSTDTESAIRVPLYEDDYNINIYEDERWLNKNRYITYINSGEATTITDEAYSDFGHTIEFMAEYFDTIIHGDAEKLCTFHSEEFFNDNPRWERISMQRLYDIEIEYISYAEAESTARYIYKVSYKIMDNDGTFRNDVKSDAKRPQYYTITDFGSTLKITDISYIYPEKTA